MLEEMSKARTSPILAAAAHVVPEIDGDDRYRMIFNEDHAEAVVQPIVFVFDSLLG